MPSHFQFTPVFSQLQFMTSEVLCGGKFKHRFHWYSRETFNHLKYFNEVSSVASFLQTPDVIIASVVYVELIKPLPNNTSVWRTDGRTDR